MSLAAERGLTLPVLASVGHPAGHLLIRRNDELPTGVCDLGEAENLNRSRRASFLDLLTMIVDQGTDTAPRRTGNHRITDPKGAALDEDGGHRTSTDVEVRLQNDALGSALGSRAKILDLGDEQDLIEQFVNADVLQRRNPLEDRVATPLLGNEVVLGHASDRFVDVGVLSVDLVDRHDDRHLGRLRVIDRLDGLRHDAVVGGHHQDDDVGGLSTTGSHLGERSVARRVDEGDLLPIALDLIRTDVLGDAAGLAVSDVGVSDAVEQQRLAVVDVTHHGDHRRTERRVVA